MLNQSLVNLFKQTLGHLSQLNDRLPEPVLSRGDLNEQLDNLEDLSKLIEEYECILEQLDLQPEDTRLADKFVLEVYRIPLQKAPFECPYCRSTSGHGGENQSKIESEQGLKPTYWVHQ